MELSQEQIDTLIGHLTFYGLKIVYALVILIVGKWLAGMIRKLLRRSMERSKVDPALIGFLSNIAFYLMMTAVVIAAIGQLGVQTTSLVAVVGAAGLAVGLALQGSLSNFASGVLIILFRPFKIGDFVEAGGVAGIVDEIGILVTEMHSPDNKKIIVPNSQVLSAQIINYSANDTRRLDLVFGIAYSDDFEKAKRLILDIIEADPRCLKDPAPTVRVLELADSSVNIATRPWVKTSEYWDVYFDLYEKVKTSFDSNGISIPFPQRDVHLYQAKS